MSNTCNFLKSTYKLFQYLNESNSLQIVIKLRESEMHYHFIELLKQIQETSRIIDDTQYFYKFYFYVCTYGCLRMIAEKS